jgi:hypothetical protein
MGLLKAAQLLLKGKSKDAIKFLVKEKGGVEAITGIAPAVSKELSQAAKAKRLQGFFKRLKNKKTK